MLKYSPKRFWSMLKTTRNNNQDIPTAAMAELNRKIFYDANAQEEGFKEIIDKEANYITPDELKAAIQ
jgi:hypothetical protein